MAAHSTRVSSAGFQSDKVSSTGTGTDWRSASRPSRCFRDCNSNSIAAAVLPDPGPPRIVSRPPPALAYNSCSRSIAPCVSNSSSAGTALTMARGRRPSGCRTSAGRRLRPRADHTHRTRTGEGRAIPRCAASVRHWLPRADANSLAAFARSVDRDGPAATILRTHTHRTSAISEVSRPTTVATRLAVSIGSGEFRIIMPTTAQVRTTPTSAAAVAAFLEALMAWAGRDTVATRPPSTCLPSPPGLIQRSSADNPKSMRIVAGSASRISEDPRVRLAAQRRSYQNVGQFHRTFYTEPVGRWSPTAVRTQISIWSPRAPADHGP